jgi:hypothetical protein
MYFRVFFDLDSSNDAERIDRARFRIIRSEDEVQGRESEGQKHRAPEEASQAIGDLFILYHENTQTSSSQHWHQ